jgi:hypothetical protein
MDMKLSLILLISFFLDFILADETRCRSYSCGALQNLTCAQESVSPDGNYNYTMQVCKDTKQFCPWSSFVPGTNGTVTCENSDTPAQKK